LCEIEAAVDTHSYHSQHVSDCSPPEGTARVCSKKITSHDFSKDKAGREGAISSRDSGGDQFSGYDEDSCYTEEDDIVVEELCFLFRTRRERTIKASDKAVPWA